MSLAKDSRVIAGVPTSVTAFVGRTLHGPTDRPGRVAAFAEFQQLYGGLWRESPLSYAVRQFFANGGREALVCRVQGNGDEGRPVTDEDIAAPGLETARDGLWLLEHADLVNILCIPPLGPDRDVGKATWDAAADYARRRRAILLVDPPTAWSRASAVTDEALESVISDGEARQNAALYFPRVLEVDPLRGDGVYAFAPCGALAGLYARTDAERGVWQAPAGRQARLAGVEALTVDLTDGEQAQLNPRAINCLRTFPGMGSVAWGARTLRGRDGSGSEWKYVPVRRLALFIEESLGRGTQWAVFEPNDEPLWAELRRGVASFLHDLFRQGALQGQTPREAYFVKCDSQTTTQADIERGSVNIVVGFAPLKPAEFVIITISQLGRPRTGRGRSAPAGGGPRTTGPSRST